MANMCGPKAHQTLPEGLEFEGRVVPSNSSSININPSFLPVFPRFCPILPAFARFWYVQSKILPNTKKNTSAVLSLLGTFSMSAYVRNPQMSFK